MIERSAGNIFRHRRLTGQEYRHMAEAGILRRDEHVELIEGEIIDMPPIGSHHAGTVNHLAKLLQRAVGDHAVVQVQNPVSLGQYSEPEPDFALLRPRADYYRSAHPRPADILMIIEVSESSLQYDREVKIPLYARHGIPETWIIDIEGKRLIRHRKPVEGAHAHTDEPDVRAPLALPSIAGIRLDCGGIFAF